MRKSFSPIFTAFLVLFGACFWNAATAFGQQGGLTPVSSVDLRRYSGKWFEIARLPNKFQKDCVGNTTVTFNTMKRDGELEILNRCLQKNGKTEQIRGEAKVAGGNTNAKMKVSLPKFSADSLWIVDLDPNYQYSVVTSPKREYLWIYSRTPQLDAGVYQQILRRIEAMGFQPNRLIKTPQDVTALKGAVVGKQ